MIDKTALKHVIYCASEAKYIMPEFWRENSFLDRKDMI